MPGSPVAEGLGAAGLIQQGNDDPQKYQEGKDTGVPGDGGDKPVIDHGIHGMDRMEAGCQQPAHQDTYEQRGIDLLRYQRKPDGDDGREQGPQGSDWFRDGACISTKHAKDYNKSYDQKFGNDFFQSHFNAPFFLKTLNNLTIP